MEKTNLNQIIFWTRKYYYQKWSGKNKIMLHTFTTCSREKSKCLSSIGQNLLGKYANWNRGCDHIIMFWIIFHFFLVRGQLPGMNSKHLSATSYQYQKLNLELSIEIQSSLWKYFETLTTILAVKSVSKQPNLGIIWCSNCCSGFTIFGLFYWWMGYHHDCVFLSANVFVPSYEKY